MRPKLKITTLTNLHDARYCAAVGINLLGFSLEKGHPKKVEVSVVAEIGDWLSGPEMIGEFGYEVPGTINFDAEKAGVAYVSIPADYPLELASEIEKGLIFRIDQNELDGKTFGELAQIIHEKFPEALIEAEIDEKDLLSLEKYPSGLMKRLLFIIPDPDLAWKALKKDGMEPFGFSLGSFFEETSGVLDYEKCDDFIEQFEKHTPI